MNYRLVLFFCMSSCGLFSSFDQNHDQLHPLEEVLQAQRTHYEQCRAGIQTNKGLSQFQKWKQLRALQRAYLSFADTLRKDHARIAAYKSKKEAIGRD